MTNSTPSASTWKTTTVRRLATPTATTTIYDDGTIRAIPAALMLVQKNAEGETRVVYGFPTPDGEIVAAEDHPLPLGEIVHLDTRRVQTRYTAAELRPIAGQIYRLLSEGGPKTEQQLAARRGGSTIAVRGALAMIVREGYGVRDGDQYTAVVPTTVEAS
jgi:hypothetical protein